MCVVLPSMWPCVCGVAEHATVYVCVWCVAELAAVTYGYLCAWSCCFSGHRCAFTFVHVAYRIMLFVRVKRTCHLFTTALMHLSVCMWLSQRVRLCDAI